LSQLFLLLIYLMPFVFNLIWLECMMP
jgi:hypothetical protein